MKPSLRFVFFLFFLSIAYFTKGQVIQPNTIAGLKMWLKADSVQTLSLSGSNITQWKNSSGTDSVAQSNPAIYPTYVSSNAEINNMPSIQFNGSSFFSGSNSADYTLNNGGSIFIILKSSDNAGNILGRLDDNSPNYGWTAGCGWWTGNNIGHFFVNGPSSYTINGTGTTITTGVFVIYEIIHAPSQGTTIFLNTNQILNNPTYIPIGTNNANLLIAQGLAANGGSTFTGDIAEILIYDNPLSQTDRQLVENYLASKYAGPPVSLGADVNSSNFCSVTLDAGNWFSDFLWSTGETTQTINVNNNGTYWVRATNAFGMYSYDTVEVNFPQIMLADTFYCAGNSVTLSTGLGGGFTYLWSTTETTSTINVNTENNYSVTVTDGLMCTAASPVIFVSEDDFPSTASLGPDTGICDGNSIGLISPFPLPSGLTYTWSNLANTATITVTSPGGTYTVTVTNDNGCSVSDQINVSILGFAPDVDFTYNPACSGSPVQFINSSQPSGDSLKWDFGDGYSSTSQTPSHTFSSSGNQTIHLVVYDGICSNFLDSTIYIPSAPTADFAVSDACADHPYYFTDQSFSSEGIIDGWDWDFGDASPHSNLQFPQHTYSASGSYPVTLTVTSSVGCSDTVTNLLNVVSSAPSPDDFSLISPIDNSVTTNTNISFVWNASAGAQYYKLEYSNDPLLQTGIVQVPSLLSTNTTQILPSGQVYYWRIKAFGICADSSVSNIRHFTIFDSDAISGMQLWLMGDSIDTLNTKVTTWKDLSGNNNDVTQTNTSLQPSYIITEASINDMPSVDFNGSSTYLSNSSPTGVNLNTGGSIFIISKSADNVGNIISKIDESSPNYGWTAGLGWWSSGFEGNFFVSGSGGYSINPAGATIASDTFNIYEIIHSSTSGTTVYKNANQTATGIYKAIDNNTAPLIIAKGISPSSNNYFSGRIAEILIFNAALSPSDRQTVENYLHQKYAPPVNLGPDIWSSDFCDTTLNASDRFISYLWNTGETTSSITLNTGGTYYVDVVDVFGFPSSDTVIVHKPIVTAASDTLCSGDSTNLHSGLSAPYITGWAWAGDTTWNEAYTIHAGDTVNLLLADTSGCTAIRQVIMTADTFPTLNLLGNAGMNACTGDIIMVDTATVDTTIIETYDWFDGTTHYNTPTFTIPSGWTTGNHSLSLTVTNARGCTANDNVTIAIQGQQPVAGFNFTTQCFGTSANTFDDTSSPVGMGSSITNWYWDFGNGDTAILGNSNLFPYVYASDGIYDVTLTVVSNQGCQKSITQQVPVYSVPVPVFSPLLGCTGIPLTMHDHSISAVGDVTSWSWNFNDTHTPDVDTSTLETPSHTYDFSGYYTVHYVVETEYGCIDSMDKTVYIRPSPDVDFSYTNVCDGNPVYFTNETVDSLGIVDMYWDFGNGNIIDLYNPIYTFDAAGTYAITLHVQSVNGCTVDFVDSVVVHAQPTAAYSPPDDICLGYGDTLSDGSTVLSPDTIAQWEWDFGDLGVYSGEHPVISFPADGTYPVTLTVWSNAGCSSSVNAVVQVNPVPEASFLPDEFYGDPPFTVIFDNNSDDNASNYWDFDDGSVTTSINDDPVTHIFGTADTFNVMLVVTNSAGCSDTTYQEVYSVPSSADVAVYNVTTLEQGDFITVNADIWNLGQRKIYALYLYAKASGGTEFMETWADFVNPLLPGSFMNYTFTAQFSVPSEQDLDYICVEAQIQNKIPDDEPGNNEECITYNNSFSAFIPFPSPSHDEIDIDYILPFADQVKIDLYDTRGRLVRHIYEGEANKGLNKLTVDISDLALAVYTYRITFNEDFKILRFVKY